MRYETIWNPLTSSLKKVVGRDVSIEFRNGETAVGELIQRDEDVFECARISFRHYDVKTIKIFPVTKVTKVRKQMSFFKYHDCNKVFIQVSHYSSNDRLAVLLFDRDEGPIATLTVNLSEERNVKANEAFIDINNVPDALEFITENDLGVLTGRIGYSGFCHYPMVEFNRKLFDMADKFRR